MLWGYFSPVSKGRENKVFGSGVGYRDPGLVFSSHQIISLFSGEAVARGLFLEHSSD